MNLNDLARDVTLKEGLKISLPIAQVKEVIKCLFISLAVHPDEVTLRILKRYRKPFIKGKVRF